LIVDYRCQIVILVGGVFKKTLQVDVAKHLPATSQLTFREANHA